MSVTGTNLNDLNTVPENQNNEMAAPTQRPTQTLHQCWNLQNKHPQRCETLWQKSALSLCGFEGLAGIWHCWSQGKQPWTASHALSSSVLKATCEGCCNWSTCTARRGPLHQAIRLIFRLIFRVGVADGWTHRNVLLLPSSLALPRRHRRTWILSCSSCFWCNLGTPLSAAVGARFPHLFHAL